MIKVEFLVIEFDSMILYFQQKVDFIKFMQMKFCSLAFESITDYIHIFDTMLKVSKKEKTDLEKEQKSLSKRKKQFNRKEAQHACILYFNYYQLYLFY